MYKTFILASVFFVSVGLFNITNADAKCLKKHLIYQKKISKQDSLSQYNLFTITNLPVKYADSLKNKYDFFYVDFWASWCGACISHIGFSKKLYEDYKSTAIALVLISVDEDEKLWKNAITKYKITLPLSYRIPNFQESSFVKFYNLSSLPRYMIFDKNGNLIVIQAPNPANPEIRELFDDLLKKK